MRARTLDEAPGRNRARYDGWVELCAGVTEGLDLVRHLRDRMRFFPRFTAAMVGLWTPAHQSKALLRSVDQG